MEVRTEVRAPWEGPAWGRERHGDVLLDLIDRLSNGEVSGLADEGEGEAAEEDVSGGRHLGTVRPLMYKRVQGQSARKERLDNLESLDELLQDVDDGLRRPIKTTNTVIAPFL